MTNSTLNSRAKRWCGYLTITLALVLLLCALAWGLVGPGFSFVATLSRPETATEEASFTEEILTVPTKERAVPLRVYRPRKGYDRAVLLAHGVHADGFNEARLTRFARDLARQGFLVAVPDLKDLKNYDLVPRIVDEIEASMRFLLDDPRVNAQALKRRPSLYGISFSGGLALCAAARPALQGRVGCVFSFGGHGDLDRVLRYLSTGELPNGQHLTPHLYGQAVLLRRCADQLVPPDQAEALRSALYLFLREKPQAFQEAVSALPAEARKIAEPCLRWDAKGAGEILKPLASRLHSDPLLSPVRGPVPQCPVFLLHGAVDNVIPPSETEALGVWAAEGTPTEVLVTDLIRHVELEDNKQQGSGWREKYRLLRFMSKLLRS